MKKNESFFKQLHEDTEKAYDNVFRGANHKTNACILMLNEEGNFVEVVSIKKNTENGKAEIETKPFIQK